MTVSGPSGVFSGRSYINFWNCLGKNIDFVVYQERCIYNWTPSVLNHDSLWLKFRINLKFYNIIFVCSEEKIRKEFYLSTSFQEVRGPENGPVRPIRLFLKAIAKHQTLRGIISHLHILYTMKVWTKFALNLKLFGFYDVYNFFYLVHHSIGLL